MHILEILVGIMTLGCKVNQYESEAIAEAMEKAGFRIVPAEEVCDLYIINTCTVTAESDRKARQFIRRAITTNPAAYIIVTGCMAQNQPERTAMIPGVDAVCGNDRKMDVVDIARRLIAQGSKNPDALIRVENLENAPFEPMCISRFNRTRAYVKIEDGCESRCAYCAIPLARGKIRSKPMKEVLREVEGLVQGGCREVVLTGIETGSWGKDLADGDFADLLCAVDAIPGIGRVRLGSLDPAIIKPEFIEKIAPLTSLTPHFHLSVQSGCTRVLALMRRKYTAESALTRMEALRAAIPGVQFTTDIITGFPGERDEDFAETVRFAQQAKFLMIHVFPYSGRAGTAAINMPDQVPMEIRRKRAAELIHVAKSVRQSILEEIICTSPEKEVLFESAENGYAYGHTPEFIEVRVPSPAPLHGDVRQVRLLRANGDFCDGELLPPVRDRH